MRWSGGSGRHVAAALLAAALVACGSEDDGGVEARERAVRDAEREVLAIAAATECDSVAQCRADFIADHTRPCAFRAVPRSTAIDENRWQAALQAHGDRVREYFSATREPFACPAVMPAPPPLECRQRRCVVAGG